jgi:hypothetical protein
MSFKGEKAPDYDHIPTHLVKNSFDIISKPLMRVINLSHTWRISGFPIGYEEVRSISNPPADVCLGGGFETLI